MKLNSINIPVPVLQINFSYALGQIRSVYLQDGLRAPLKNLLEVPTGAWTHPHFWGEMPQKWRKSRI